MELIEYLRFLYRYAVWLVIGLIIGGALGAGYAVTQKDAYKATLSLFVQRQTDASGQTPYYTYDGYYAQQSAAAYTDNAIKLLTNDEIVTRAAKQANLYSGESSVNNLRGAITVKKDAPQLISLSVVLPKHDDAANFTSGLADALRTRTTELNQDGDKKLAVDPVNTQPFVVLVRPLLPLYAAVGAGLGLLLAIAVAALWAYTRYSSRR